MLKHITKVHEEKKFVKRPNVATPNVPKKKKNIEKYSCFICEAKFDQDAKLKNHILAEHEG